MKLKFDLKSIKPKLKKLQKLAGQHAMFAAVLIVLFVYLFVVWKINSFASAEPSKEAEDTAMAKTKIPRVDPQAINKIQSLEQSNAQVHSLFNQARNNPFQE